MKRYLFLATLILFFITHGCASLDKLGRLRIQSADEEINIDYLMANWQRFYIYYDGNSLQDPWAILFDPKSDGKEISADAWQEVTDEEQLGTVYTWVRSRGQMFVKLYRVLGPDLELYGYMYSKRKDVNIRAVDAKTLWVDNFPAPMDRYGP